jgi:hypothetical protein
VVIARQSVCCLFNDAQEKCALLAAIVIAHCDIRADKLNKLLAFCRARRFCLFHEQGDVIDRSFYKTIASMHFLNWHRRIFRSGSGRARRFLNSREGGEVGLPARAIVISSFFPQTHLKLCHPPEVE